MIKINKKPKRSVIVSLRFTPEENEQILKICKKNKIKRAYALHMIINQFIIIKEHGQENIA